VEIGVAKSGSLLLQKNTNHYEGFCSVGVALICLLLLKGYTNSVTEETLEMCFAIGSHVLNTATPFTQPFTA